MLAKHVHFSTMVIQGGEPLLHPRLDELIRISIGSGLARRIHVRTNGELLHKMSDQFWNEVDQVEIATRPGIKIQGIPPERVKKVRLTRSENPGSFSTKHTWDMELVKKIKDSCDLFSRCCALSGYYFYKCVTSSFIPSQLKHEVLTSETVDGIMLEETDEFEGKLFGYLDNKGPLKSCEFCAGTSGRSVTHGRPTQESWISKHDRPIQELVNTRRL
jgi:hypothetical protein